MFAPGTCFQSPGGSFQYIVQGPVCRLYDREELPWPCCRLSWRGKEPSWNRIGRRFVGDLAAKRHPSYSLIGVDRDGNTWQDVQTDYTYVNRAEVVRWWYSNPLPEGHEYPSEYPTRA